MQANLDLSSSSPKFNDEQFAEISAKTSEDFDLKLNIDESQLENDESQLENEDYNEEEEEYEGNNEEDEDEDFTFVINGSDSSPISADDVFHDGQIRPYFPLFNRDLLLAHEDFKISDHRLPLQPPVEKVFIETPSSSSSSSQKPDESDRIVTGPYCVWTKTPQELSNKSTSTGFSKLWRFKEYMHRSHSDGRDAFVFLNNSETKREVKKTAGVEKNTGNVVKVNSVGEGKKKKVVKKVQKKGKALSAHEVYLRNKGYSAEEDKRRSYLPYRPVGLFTNVNGGGLSKNVHPY